MDNPLELLKDSLQGDIEVAGKKVPKIALIAGGGALIGGLIIISRKGGQVRSGASASPIAGTSGDGSGLTPEDSGNANSDFLTGALNDVQAQFEDRFAQQATDLGNLITQNANDTQANLDSQLSSVYDQLNSSGALPSVPYFDQVAPLPVDNIPFTQEPFNPYPIDAFVNPATTVNTKPDFYTQLPVHKRIPKPSQVKKGLDLSNKKPGVHGSSQLSTKDKLTKLSVLGGKKLKPTSPITNFDKKPPLGGFSGINSTNDVLNKSQKHHIKPVTGKALTFNPKPIKGQKPNMKPVTGKALTFIPKQNKPIVTIPKITNQPVINKTPNKISYYKPNLPAAKPIAKIPAYKPPIVIPYSPLPISPNFKGSPIGAKNGSKVYKKGK